MSDLKQMTLEELIGLALGLDQDESDPEYALDVWNEVEERGVHFVNAKEKFYIKDDGYQGSF